MNKKERSKDAHIIIEVSKAEMRKFSDNFKELLRWMLIKKQFSRYRFAAEKRKTRIKTDGYSYNIRLTYKEYGSW